MQLLFLAFPGIFLLSICSVVNRCNRWDSMLTDLMCSSILSVVMLLKLLALPHGNLRREWFQNLFLYLEVQASDLLLAGQGRLFYKCRDCGLYRDVLTWSNLVVVRMPLIHVSRVLKEHFATTPPPSSNKIAHKLGLSGTIGGPVHTLATLLLKQEARCAHDFQKNCTLGGQMCFFNGCY